jgi:hypothetical protein
MVALETEMRRRWLAHATVTGMSRPLAIAAG